MFFVMQVWNLVGIFSYFIHLVNLVGNMWRYGRGLIPWWPKLHLSSNVFFFILQSFIESNKALFAIV